jgi:hypothetical protein
MRYTLASLLFCIPLLAVGQVYKWTDADGKAHYSDRPVTGAKTLDVPHKKMQHGQGQTAGPSATEQPSPGPYGQLTIATPEDGATLRQAEGNVQVGLVLDPALMEGHRIQLVVDGNPVAGKVPGTQFTINGLSFGSHQLEARILDSADAKIATTSSIRFNLLRPEAPPPGL